jgi:hypothetical protein
MTVVQRAVGIVVVSVVLVVGTLLLESHFIADPDLRYPIVLLTKVLGLIVVVIFIARAVFGIAKAKVLAAAPEAHGGFRNFGTALLLTMASVGGCAFGISLMLDRPGVIEYWPLGIVVVFGGFTALGLGYLLREWQIYRRFRRKS